MATIWIRGISWYDRAYQRAVEKGVADDVQRIASQFLRHRPDSQDFRVENTVERGTGVPVPGRVQVVDPLIHVGAVLDFNTVIGFVVPDESGNMPGPQTIGRLRPDSVGARRIAAARERRVDGLRDLP